MNQKASLKNLKTTLRLLKSFLLKKLLISVDPFERIQNHQNETWKDLFMSFQLPMHAFSSVSNLKYSLSIIFSQMFSCAWISVASSKIMYKQKSLNFLSQWEH